MSTAIRSLFVLALAASSLAACSAENSANEKAVADLRADLQRAQKDADKQHEQIANIERKLAGMAEDLASMRKTTMDVAAASTGKAQGANATNGAADPAGATPGDGASAGAVVVDAQKMKTFFDSEEGKKTFAAAMKAAQDQQAQEQAKRAVDGLLARLAKDANLTDDQQKKMKDILDRGAAQLSELRQSIQGGAGFGDPEVRQKFVDLRTNTDNEVKTVLSQSQFDTYQKSMTGVLGGFGGFGGRPRGGAGGGGN